jgi:hypothetical protein
MQGASYVVLLLFREESLKKRLNSKDKPQEETFCHLFDVHYPDMNRFCSNENEIVENYTSL